MTLQRRGFLGAILMAGVAPAIVKASSLMKIIVPSQDIIVPFNFNNQSMLFNKDIVGRGMTQSIYHIDEAGWFDPDKADERIREMRRVEMPMDMNWFMPPRAPIPMRPLQRS